MEEIKEKDYKISEISEDKIPEKTKNDNKLENNSNHCIPEKAIDDLQGNIEDEERHQETTKNSYSLSHLLILCHKNHLPEPYYVLRHESGPAHLKLFSYECIVGEMTEQATGETKLISKRLAAEKMMKRICLSVEENEGNPDTKNTSTNLENVTEVPPIVKLEMLCSENNFLPPSFTLKLKEGKPHNPIFIFECKVGDIVECGRAHSKKKAKHDAAKKVLEVIKKNLKLSMPNKALLKDEKSKEICKFTSTLLTECSLPDLEFEYMDGSANEGYTCQCRVGDLIENATASKKIDSRHLATKQMLDKIESVYGPRVERNKKVKMSEPIELLQCFCSSRKLPCPEFSLISEEGPPHNRLFTLQCKVNDVVEIASGKTKSQSKHLAASKVLEVLRKKIL